ncbi:MAG TPA: hypothetical protein VIJ14_09625 [Rhabdochlamydiaceae bacterium]
MALWGVSGSDVTNYGWNTAVGFGVLVGCAATAYAVKYVAAMALASSKTMKQDTKDSYSAYAGIALGLAAAAAAYKFVPASRFALISDDSTSKMFKLGIVQTIVGLIIDGFVSTEFNTAAIVGFGGAAVTRFGYLPLAALGAVGAGLGSGFIAR